MEENIHSAHFNEAYVVSSAAPGAHTEGGGATLTKTLTLMDNAKFEKPDDVFVRVENNDVTPEELPGGVMAHFNSAGDVLCMLPTKGTSAMLNGVPTTNVATSVYVEAVSTVCEDDDAEATLENPTNALCRSAFDAPTESGSVEESAASKVTNTMGAEEDPFAPASQGLSATSAGWSQDAMLPLSTPAAVEASNTRSALWPELVPDPRRSTEDGLYAMETSTPKPESCAIFTDFDPSGAAPVERSSPKPNTALSGMALVVTAANCVLTEAFTAAYAHPSWTNISSIA